MKKKRSFFFLSCLFIFLSLPGKNRIVLQNEVFSLSWAKTGGEWTPEKIILKSPSGDIIRTTGSGTQTILFSTEKPSSQPAEKFLTSQGTPFPEPVFIYPAKAWESNLTTVSLNTWGSREQTTKTRLIRKNPLTFESASGSGIITTTWTAAGNSIRVHQVFKALKTGYYGISTPDIFTVKPENIRKAVIPGYLIADTISDDFVSAYGYGYAIPDRPVIYRDRGATTPVVILSDDALSVSIAPESSYPRKPHDATANTHMAWHIGLGIMDTRSQITPLLYYPVAGQHQSFMEKGTEITFEYRYMISGNDWYDLLKEAIYDVFDFRKQKELLHNKQSLISRVFQMYAYLTDRNTSRFRITDCDGIKTGAQDYLGGVAESDKDAMKNSDYGAMWMLASLTRDTLLTENVLPYARNFKLKQIYTGEGKFRGAVKGQYFLWKSNQWAEEWGQHIEPIGVMYYALADMGNILLFNPEDHELRENFRQAAAYLSDKQKADGSWDLGYEKSDNSIIYPDLKDYRPTFYGMLIAYIVLKEKKYLDAAVRGADWFIQNAVEKDKFTGVCGDTRFAPDFATSQSVQALLEMYKTTGETRYKQAAIQTAKIYTTYIYTWPNGITETQNRKGQNLPGWAFSQSGLCFEHAGTIGSSNTRGPILLASHAGMFVRMFRLTGDSLFIDLARAAANGKDAFVDKATGVASYYWDSFNAGAGSFPHHAWWQIGWIMDYLMSEAELRSEGRISFPRGFITPKVGPHQALGFSDGTIDGKSAKLILEPGLVTPDNPECDYLTILSGSRLYVLAMNSGNKIITTNITIRQQNGNTIDQEVTIRPYGLNIVEEPY